MHHIKYHKHSRGPDNYRLPKRYILAILSFCALMCTYSMQVDLNLTLLSMIRRTRSARQNDTRKYVECQKLVEPDESSTQSRTYEPNFNWNAQEQAVILGAFYFGCVLSQLPGGFLAQQLSPKWVCGLGVLSSAVINLLIPTAATFGAAAVAVARVLQGLSQGVVKPSLNVLIGRWSPKLERSRFFTFVMSGANVGSVLAMPISGVISSSSTLGGWPFVFYLFGSISCGWFMVWIYFIYDNVDDHPNISNAEYDYIESYREDMGVKASEVPWKAILTSLPMWAVVVGQFGSSFGFLILFTELPNYLEHVLHFNIRQNGEISAIPYIMQAMTGWVVSFVADDLRKSEQMSVTNIRKLFTTIGVIGPAILLMCVTISGCQPKIIVALIAAAMALNGFTYSGFYVTPVDMSPDFAGALLGLSNTFSSISGVIGPSFVSFLTSDRETIPEWNKVFYTIAVIYVVTTLFYDIFASAEVQPWSTHAERAEEMPMLRRSSTALRR